MSELFLVSSGEKDACIDAIITDRVGLEAAKQAMGKMLASRGAGEQVVVHRIERVV